VELLAERFAITGKVGAEHRAIDLSTGGVVTVLVSTAGGPSDAMRWSLRCDRFLRVRHWSIARLVDYGLFGPTSRFEAWRCAGRWYGDERPAERALSYATRFLRAIDGDSQPFSIEDVRLDGRWPVVLPGPHIRGDAAAVVPASADTPLECGITIVDRPSIGAIEEILRGNESARAAVLLLRTSDAVGASVAVQQIARAARLHGFIPLAADRVDRQSVDLLSGRTLCLIDRGGGRHAWQSLVTRTLATPKPHLLVSIGPHRVPCAATLHLEPLSAEALTLAVVPPLASSRLRAAVGRLARQAEGKPGGFVAQLWRGRPSLPASVTPVQSIAAERRPVYGEALDDRPAPDKPRPWLVSSDLATHRKRLSSAVAMLDTGRHAAAERDLRAVVGHLARRHDWRHAWQGQIALAGWMLKRGRPRTADQLLAEARGYAEKDKDDHAIIQTGVALGHARLDDGRLDEAEATFHVTLGAARAAGSADCVRLSAAGLARCLFWRGRYTEASEVIDGIAGGSEPDMHVELLRSRIGVGLGDVSKAMAHAVRARERATALSSPGATARAQLGLAFVHLAAGDLQAVDRDVHACVRAAQAAHDPLCAWRARILAAEAARRSGTTSPIRPLVDRARRLRLPLIVQVRLALVADAAGGSCAEARGKHVSATRLHALALFLPNETHERLTSAFATAIDILQLSHRLDDEGTALTEMCRLIRARLRAAAVGVFVRDAAALTLAAVDGGRIETPIAQRVVDARQSILPHQCGERIEGGVPVRQGSDTVGVIAVRWTLAAPPDALRAEMMLTMTAAAAASAIAALAARRRVAATRALDDLVGVSQAIADVRAAVERAASAPFSVLIEGESGAGKELVARALHRRSLRRDHPFCTLNCAALPEDLVDAELFGHSRGAFTGALADRAGVFEAAHLGTLFLDEIGELSPRAQAKILRTLQEGELRRIGENQPRRVDARLVAATNRDLREEVAAQRFRLDLLYRLDVIRITVPPLRERPEDIPLLAEHFWQIAIQRVGSRAVLAARTVGALARYHWPGNVRELQNVLAALAVRAPRRGIVPETALPSAFTPAGPAGTDLHAARRTFEERFIRAALARAGGHRARAAEELGLSRQGLAKLMARLRIAD
jgi:DNA-binding NtrC family response regulator